MKALVSGATGFAGQHLIAHLLDCDDKVLGCCQSGHVPGAVTDERIESLPLLAWDLAQGLDQNARQRIEQFAPDAIYHLGAISVPADCGPQQPTDGAWAVNVRGTRAVLQLASSLTSAPRVLVVSSSYVYGRVSRTHPYVDEDAPRAPHNGYGRSKQAAEAEASEAVARGLKVVTARAFQHTGPGQSPRMMLPEWCEQLVRAPDQPLRVITLDAWLDLSDVGDVVRAYRLLVERGQSGAVYNVGSGINRRCGDILEELFTVAGCRPAIIESAPGWYQHPIADCSRIARDTGWQPRIALGETLARTWDWWRGQVAAA